MVLHLPYPEGGFGVTFNDVNKDAVFYTLLHVLWLVLVLSLRNVRMYTVHLLMTHLLCYILYTAFTMLGKSTREGVKRGVCRHERMKRERGMKGRDERTRGIEICISDDFTMIKPTAPFKLAKHGALRKRNWSDSSGSSLAKLEADASRRECKKSRRMKSSYKCPVVSTVKGMKTIGSGWFK